MTPPPDAADGERGLVLADIDGVVADVSHRLVHLRRQPKDWDSFFAAMSDDPLLHEGAAVVRRATADHDLAWITGRPARYADTTAAWLATHRLPDAPVHHRADGDRRPAPDFKADTVRRIARTRRVLLLIDDDPDVCAAVEAAGFGAFLATWAPADASRSSTLHQAQHDEGRT